MGKIGKAIGFPGMDDSDDESDMDMDMDSPDSEAPEKSKGAGTAEVLAMKQFERAATPEAKAQAMKDFLEACGVTY